MLARPRGFAQTKARSLTSANAGGVLPAWGIAATNLSTQRTTSDSGMCTENNHSRASSGALRRRNAYR
jgi:hypothetical protein